MLKIIFQNLLQGVDLNQRPLSYEPQSHFTWFLKEKPPFLVVFSSGEWTQSHLWGFDTPSGHLPLLWRGLRDLRVMSQNLESVPHSFSFCGIYAPVSVNTCTCCKCRCQLT